MRSILFAIIFCLTLPAHFGWAQEKRPPNVLWICGDDHAPYVIGAYGNNQVRTPNLDRLASQGMRFDRAFCNSPVCTASRQSFITSRYPRTIGVTQLKTPLAENEVTLAEVLKRAGYNTAAIGKMHFNSPLKHGFALLIDLPQHRAWLEAKGRSLLPSGVEVQPPWKPFKDPASVWLNSACRPFGLIDADMAGTFFAQQAAKFLRDRRDKPFFLIASFYEPHSPFYFPVEYRGWHKPEEFTVPKVGPEDDWQIPKIFRNLTDREKQGIIAAYYTSAEFLDKNIGTVLDALEKSGQAENTLVIYTGDHGYMLGQHGRFEKHCGYEPAVHSALLMRYPGKIKLKQSTKALVEFIDIFPTVLDYAGVPIPSNVQGKSLVPVLSGKTRRHREQVFIEYSENEEAYIRTDRWKFIYSTGKRVREDGYVTDNPQPGRTIQLFDLKRDPEEMQNLAQRPEFSKTVEDFTRRLAERLKRTARQPELIPQTDDVHAILEFCLQPRDVTGTTKLK
ncbi:MAG: sulfatase [Verrucomicrobia bacterium]|nr:sulfatase [Verrucomicrobiota bacterium]